MNGCVFTWFLSLCFPSISTVIFLQQDIVSTVVRQQHHSQFCFCNGWCVFEVLFSFKGQWGVQCNNLKVDGDAFFLCNECAQRKGKKCKFCVQLTKLQSGLQYRTLATVTHANPPLLGTSGSGHPVGSAPWHAINQWSFNKLVYVVSCFYGFLQTFLSLSSDL